MGVNRIEIALRQGFRDALAESTKRRMHEDLGLEAKTLSTIQVFTTDAELNENEIRKIADAFADPVIQEYKINAPAANSAFDFAAEIGFRPGVTDNVGRTAREAMEYIVGRKLTQNEAVYTSTQYLFGGSLSKEQIAQVCSGLLCNELIERWEVKGREEFGEKGFEAKVPKVKEDYAVNVREINLDVSDGELMKISKEGVLALNLEEMKAIRDYFKNKGVIEKRKKVGLSSKPTDVELEALAQTWSEHCKHKIFNARIRYNEGNRIEEIDSLFKIYVKSPTEKIKKDVNWLLSIFSDNAGVIRFNKDSCIAMKVETHNSPSALDPYGGAITGIVGVNRDPMGTGKGCRLIFNTDVFCFANPYWKGDLPPRMLHPKRIFEGVRKGVEHGGNKSGIPTVNGTLVFDDRYRGKPLVYCGTGGIMPYKIRGKPSWKKESNPGDLIVMCGGRIGKDGIHGATFSSEELHEGSPATAVQIGDPITQKKMHDCLLEARDLGLYNCITDNGAGGLSSSVGETAEFSNGCEMHLEEAPLKYAGLQPWEILLSEAQERMTLAVPKKNEKSLRELCIKHGVEMTVLGTYKNTGNFHVLYDGKTVAYIDMDFMHKGLPRMHLEAEWEKLIHEEPDFAEPADLAAELKSLLSSLNVCSKEYVVRQYDHEVQGSSIVKPLTGAKNDGPSDAAVLKPIYNSWEGLVISNGINPKISDIDTYDMAANAIDEALRNAVAVGANPERIALLDNFCWCDPIYDREKTPDGKYKLAQLVRACKALRDYCIAFKTPCISGKDSMKNDYKIGNTKISIPPTLLISALGKMDDVRKAVTMDAKNVGDIVYILGETKNELGASEYLALKGCIGNTAPKVNAKTALKLYKSLYKAISAGLVASCHDISNGGIAVCAAEAAFAGMLGMQIDARKIPSDGIKRDDYLLFSESASRFIVTIAEQKKNKFEKIMKGNVFAEIGIVTKGPKFAVIGLDGKEAINAGINELKQAWKKTLDW
ncbi:MAG: phosphoribosylformylglycinamidine synthase subunit PurL [Candidatus Diapherotrites archaeon]|uniref:Phosphoribosylformylglycinamidine synthase subunit PurL n=1 Tax=Candidatus Iainarchaeum sp. TaxID=3101447 RepID=A0A8T4KUL6_9ARCH|nr:phosphoribosylformylglycinamidine synthase subunit PurL [Candidatus Diapherotrites archaeon]